MKRLRRKIGIGIALLVLANPGIGAPGSIWSGAQQHGEGWLSLDWFGWFKELDPVWIYHTEHGYLYVSGESTASLYLCDLSLENTWFWTSQGSYPYLYRLGIKQGWYWCYRGGVPGDRWFHRFQDQVDLHQTEMLPPAAPTQLSVLNVTDSTARLTWLDNSTNEEGFEVGTYTPLYPSGNLWNPWGTLPANTTAADLSGLQAGSEYIFYVKAFNKSGNASSNACQFTPLAANLEFYASMDNALVYNSLDSTVQETVFSNSDFGVGNNWSWMPFTGQDVVSYAAALWFDIQSQIQGRSIKSAILEAWVKVLPASWDTVYEAAAFAYPWYGNQITYSNMPNTYTVGVVSVSPPVTAALPVRWNITTIVRNWASGAWVNNGILLSDPNYVFPYGTFYRATIFQSLEDYTDHNQRPKLVIEFQ